MLKVIYLETGSYLEPVTEPAGTFIAERLAFAASLGAPLIAEPGWASVLLCAEWSSAATLASEPGVNLCRSETEFIEVSLAGTWLAATGAEEGLFVVELSATAEQALMALWQYSRTREYCRD